MELTFAPRDILQVNDTRIIYRNFRGEGSKFNREGDRNFAMIIPTQDLADELINRGWNVKIKEPREEGEEPFMYLPIKVKFNDRGPQIYLVTGDRTNRLDEDVVSMLDDIDIRSVDLDIGPYDWEVNGKTGRRLTCRRWKLLRKLIDLLQEWLKKSIRRNEVMNNTTRIIIAGIFGYTAYRISKELSSAFIAVKAINCGMMLETTGNEKR